MTVGKSPFSEPVSMEVLKYLFSSTDDRKVEEVLASTSGLEELLAQNPVIESQIIDGKKTAEQNPEQNLEQNQNQDLEQEPELAQAEAKEISEETATANVKIDHIITQSDDGEVGSITKNELVKILEAAVSVIMDSSRETAHTNLPQVLQHSSATGLAPQAAAMLEEKDSEINELKTLLVEAQSTIIKLLTDRVEDRSKLATLESQAKFLPDFQRTNAQAMSAAMGAANNDLLLRDLGKVKAEIERLKGSRGQSLASLDNAAKAGIWDKLRRWLTN